MTHPHKHKYLTLTFLTGMLKDYHEWPIAHILTYLAVASEKNLIDWSAKGSLYFRVTIFWLPKTITLGPANTWANSNDTQSLLKDTLLISIHLK